MTGVRVKVCGITRQEDAQAAVDAGVSAIGFVFWPGSPRAISVERAAAIAARVPPTVLKVGVFVDQPRAFVESAVQAVALDGIQLHGNEDAADYGGIRDLVLKAIRIDADGGRTSMTRLGAHVLPLLDAADDVRKGGTGMRVDWQAAAALAAERRVALAGGLAPSNIAEAIERVRPYAVDVSSGVESAPGLKDAARISAFVDAVRAAAGAVPQGAWS